MACQKKAEKKLNKAQKAARKGFSAQAERANEFAAKLQERADHANEWAQKEVSPRLQEQIDRAAPVVENAVSNAREKASLAAAALATKLDSAEAPAQLQQVVTKATGNKKAVKKYQKKAAKAAQEFAKQQKKANKKSHKGLVFCGLLLAGAAAGVAAWRASRPVEDPWKTPADPAPAAPQKPVAQQPVVETTEKSAPAAHQKTEGTTEN